jgi:subtilisin family serine protease
MAPGWWVTGASSAQPPGDGTSYDFSAESHCTLKGMRGTSMSTPIVSGHAALIREYFMKGFYPNGEKLSADSFVPSGALLKAMLIHSAEPLAYSVSRSSGSNVATSISSETIPNNQQGFGRIQLSNVIQIGQQSTGHS